MEKDKNQNCEFSIRIGNKRIPVTEEVYLAYYTMGRRERYLEEQDRSKGLLYFSAADSETFNGAERIQDQAVDVEKVAIMSLMIDELYEYLNQLNERERQLIEDLYFREYSLRKTADKYGIDERSIRRRRDAALLLLRKKFKE